MKPDDDLLTRVLAFKVAHLTAKQLKAAVEQQKRDKPYKPLSQVLLERGEISSGQFKEWVSPARKKELLRQMQEEEEAFWRNPGPRQVGKFTAMREIGRGGRGAVWEGTGPGAGRVAVKFLDPRHSFDLEEVERFLRESETLARLAHPGLVKILDHGWLGSAPYCVMEFVAGEPLLAFMKEGRKPLDWHAGILLKVLEILDYLHGRSVLHRDVKPENILVTPEETVYLTDFGTTLYEGEQDPDGVVVGTPNFMSPEQAEGGVPLDRTTDLYSLGVTLYEIATGKQPFREETRQELLDSVIHQKFVPPRKENPEVPEPLEAIILKAMARKPKNRYASAAGMADDLGRWRRGEPVRARKPGFWSLWS